MERTRSPSIKQKRAFEIMLAEIKDGKSPSLKDIMLKAGFAYNSATNPQLNLTSKDAWQSMLNQINNQDILNVFYEIINDRDNNGKLKDKDAVIKSAKELATLKDLYPATKNKIIGLFDKISDLQDIVE